MAIEGGRKFARKDYGRQITLEGDALAFLSYLVCKMEELQKKSSLER